MKCRFCQTDLENEFIDLGFSPPSNAFLTEEDLNKAEIYYPLKTLVCHNCFLVQIDEYAKHDTIFNDEYIYFSSFSKSWLNHANEYVNLVSKKFNLNDNSLVIEIASNDGYLLQYFQEKNIPVLGIEPTSNTAAIAQEKGIETIVDFFGSSLADKLTNKGVKADLLLGNNVLAHVPDINDFVEGMQKILKDDGIITMEFPHLLQLIENSQFDTIYHEHYSYLSLITVIQIFESKSLEIFDVTEITTHGGSLRIFAKHKKNNTIQVSKNVNILIEKEIKMGLKKLETYQAFQKKAEKIKNEFLTFLLNAKNNNKTVVAYGAAAKGNTLLNFCGIKKDLISFVADASKYKINKFLPGTHIPVCNETEIKIIKPDYVIILPWNLKDEISAQLNYIYESKAKFVVVIPNLEIF